MLAGEVWIFYREKHPAIHHRMVYPDIYSRKVITMSAANNR